jgi:hypothetical protein
MIEAGTMKTPLRIAAVHSLLAEGPVGSGARKFRGEAVLTWTLRRLRAARGLTATGIICWEDQAAEVRAAVDAVEAGDRAVRVLVKKREGLADIEAVAAAQRWSDGWRGGLMQSCHFDAGFHGGWVKELLKELECDAAVLIEPSSALVDAGLIDGLIAHAVEHSGVELCFVPAPPGFGAALVREELVNRLAEAQTHPGRLLCYDPRQPGADPLGGEGCAAAPTRVVRAGGRFRVDSDRQLDRCTTALAGLNGTLATSDAETIVRCVSEQAPVGRLPDEVVLELNVNRATRAVYQARSHIKIRRAAITRGVWERVIGELAEADDIRLTIGGVGDPVLFDELFELLALADRLGIRAVNVETDLDCDAEVVKRLGRARVDVISVFVPGMTEKVYREVMGVDGLARVVENIKVLVETRAGLGRGTPLIVPTFVKCRQNLAEMETWYDCWIKALGSAVIVGPSDFDGQIPVCEAADMRPPRRCACRRLAGRMTILCDGTIVACEQDVKGVRALGCVGVDRIADVWGGAVADLRAAHAAENYGAHPLCGGCRHWDRP